MGVKLGSSETPTLTIDATNNRLGIGTASPAYGVTLTTGNTAGFAQINSSGATIATYATTLGWIGTITSHPFAIYIANGAARLVVDTDGDVGIGTGNSASYRLDVLQDLGGTYAARIFHDGNNANRYGMLIQCGEDAPASGVSSSFIDFSDGDGTATGAIYADATGVMQYADVSDVRQKTNIAPSTVSGVDTLRAIELIEYQRVKGEHLYEKNPIGFSAQNCQEAFPSMVMEHHSGTLMVAPNALIPVLCKAIQELAGRLEYLEAKEALRGIEAL